MKQGDLIQFLLDDYISDLDATNTTASAKFKFGIVLKIRSYTVDVLRNGKIDLMVPLGWLEVVNEAR